MRLNNYWSKGFTLMEIITVLAIIGIISAISLPVYQMIRPTLNLNSTTRDIVSDLRYAQQLAVSEQINYAVNFDLALKKYTISNAETGTVIKVKTVDNGVTINAITGLTDNTAIFNVTGGVTEEGSLTLINSQNITTEILIKPSGYVKIQ